MTDVLLTFLGMNLFAAAAVALVMALRAPARRLFGARVAYGLWALVPLAGLVLLLPAREVTVAVPAAPQAPQQMVFEAGLQAASAPSATSLLPFVVALWAAGVVVSLAWLAWRQIEFGRAARHGLAGPAVIGLLRPRIITPFDFARRYTPREQVLILAHETTHIARRDTLVNAATALAACVNWFNPAIHLMAGYIRIDQELACDAQVVAAHPTARRSYAEAMLKTQLDARPLPVGCYWPAQGRHPLAERVRLLSRHPPGRARRTVGAATVALLGLAAACSAWAARPARIVQVPVAAPAEATSPHPIAVARVASTEPRKEDANAEAAPPRALAAVEAPVTEPDIAAAPAPVEASFTPSELSPRRISRIHSVARQSAVEPGSAVRVLAVMTDPDGIHLTTDLTAFGSQSAYRTGYFERYGSRYALFTSVRQVGDRLWVTASLNRRFEPHDSGTIALRSGETGDILLGNGQIVTVTPTVRPETPEEIAEGQQAERSLSARFDALKNEPWRTDHTPRPPRRGSAET